MGFDVPAAWERLKKVAREQHNRDVKWHVDTFNLVMEHTRKIDAAYRAGEAKISKEVFDFTPHRYVVTGRLDGDQAMAKIQAALLKDEGVVRRHAEWKQSELARLEKKREDDLALEKKIREMSAAEWFLDWQDKGDRDQYLQKTAQWAAETDRRIAEVKASQPSVSTAELGKVLWDPDRWHTSGPGRFEADGYTVVLSATHTVNQGVGEEARTRTRYREGTTQTDGRTTGDSTADNAQWNMTRGAEIGAGGPAPAPTAKGTVSEQLGGSRTYTTNQSETQTHATAREKSNEAQLSGQGVRQEVTVRATLTDSYGKQTTVDLGRVEVVKK